MLVLLACVIHTIYNTRLPTTLDNVKNCLPLVASQFSIWIIGYSPLILFTCDSFYVDNDGANDKFTARAYILVYVQYLIPSLYIQYAYLLLDLLAYPK